jgi:hypothetical protein
MQMNDYDIHSCGYYCDQPACIEVQRNELRDKLFSDQAVKTYSGGKPNYTQPIEQEPIAYINVENRSLEWATPTRWETPTVVKMDKVPLYTAPPQRNDFNPDWDAMAVMVEEQQRMAKRIKELEQHELVGLTDDEYETMAEQYVTNCYFDTLKYAKAIEAKLKKKNTKTEKNIQTSDNNG